MKNYESKEPCVCCNLIGRGSVTYHHIMSRKAYPEYKEDRVNMLPLCLSHHNMIHNKGLDYMANKFSSVKKWLEKHNWEYNESLKKWRFNRDKT